MKTLILLAMLVLAVPAHAADWVDQGDGTWTVSVTFTAPTTSVKNQLEQCRKFSNYRIRLLADQQNASDWLSGMMFGITNTQHPGDDGAGNPVYHVVVQLYRTLWQEFTNTFVPASSTDPLTDGLAVVVPAPPATPAP